LAAVLPLSAASSVSSFHKGQTVVIYASNSNNQEYFNIEREATEQFRSEKKFKVVGTPKLAAFVFLILVQGTGNSIEEHALAVPTGVYLQTGVDLQGLRAAAWWQGFGSPPVSPGKITAEVLSAGMSGYFTGMYGNATKTLVKRFHHDVHPY
jgi:hypothetical protein